MSFLYIFGGAFVIAGPILAWALLMYFGDGE